MNTATLEIDAGRTEFRPLTELAGAAAWELVERPESAAVRLFWFTRGKGTQDVRVVEEFTVAAPAPQDRCEFRFTLPAGPYSFSGKLISLLWAVELVIKPHGLVRRAEFSLSPTGREIQLQQQAESP